MSKSIYSKDHKYIIEQLKKTRKEMGLKQSEVARLLGKTQSYVSKIEAGQRKIDIIVLKEFTRIYKKDIIFFIR